MNKLTQARYAKYANDDYNRDYIIDMIKRHGAFAREELTRPFDLQLHEEIAYNEMAYQARTEMNKELRARFDAKFDYDEDYQVVWYWPKAQAQDQDVSEITVRVRGVNQLVNMLHLEKLGVNIVSENQLHL
jgi:hypothetical protein